MIHLHILSPHKLVHLLISFYPHLSQFLHTPASLEKQYLPQYLHNVTIQLVHTSWRLHILFHSLTEYIKPAQRGQSSLVHDFFIVYLNTTFNLFNLYRAFIHKFLYSPQNIIIRLIEHLFQCLWNTSTGTFHFHTID